MSRAHYWLTAVTGLITLALGACGYEATGPQPTTATFSMDVLDGAHGTGGNQHFFFLRPLLTPPLTFDGTFDPTQSPTVQICLWNGAACDGSDVAAFSMAAGAGDERLRVDTLNEQYIVNWHTSRSNAMAGQIYRIRVLVGTTELGFADVAIVRGGGRNGSIGNGGLTSVAERSTLPIKFRIEYGAVQSAVVFGSDGQFAALATSDSSAPVSVLGIDGSKTLYKVNPTTGKLVGATFSYRDNQTAAIFIAGDGTLEKAVFGDIIVLYANQTDSTVDVAVILPEGHIRVARSVPLTNGPAGSVSAYTGPSANRLATLSEARALPADFTRALAQTSDPLTFTVGGYTVTQRDLETLSLAMSWASCTVLTFSSAADPLLIPGAFLTCGLAYQQWLSFRFGPTSPTEVAGVADAIMAANGCGAGELIDCVSLATSAGSAVWDSANQALTDHANDVQAGRGVLMGGNGDIQITLTWDNVGDVDLHVIDPTGTEIYYANDHSPSGGTLDFDNTHGYGPENIFWPAGAAPAGTYRVFVVYYAGSVSPINFTVVVTVNGVTQTYHGQVVAEDQSVGVTSFTFGAVPISTDGASTSSSVSSRSVLLGAGQSSPTRVIARKRSLK